MNTESPETDPLPSDPRTISFVLDGQTVPFLESVTYAAEDSDEERTIEAGMEWEIDPGAYSGTIVVHRPSPALGRLSRLYERQREFDIMVSLRTVTDRTRLRFVSCTISGYSYRETADSETVIEFDWCGVHSGI